MAQIKSRQESFIIRRIVRFDQALGSWIEPRFPQAYRFFCEYAARLQKPHPLMARLMLVIAVIVFVISLWGLF